MGRILDFLYFKLISIGKNACLAGILDVMLKNKPLREGARIEEGMAVVK